MNTQELVERLQSWAVDFDAQSETVDGGLHRHIFQLRAQVARASAERLSEMEAEIKRLMKIVEGAASMRFLDAEDVKGEIVFRFTMPGNQLFNKPQFHVEARAALEHQQKGEDL